jgi:hypothetical protein
MKMSDSASQAPEVAVARALDRILTPNMVTRLAVLGLVSQCGLVLAFLVADLGNPLSTFQRLLLMGPDGTDLTPPIRAPEAGLSPAGLLALSCVMAAVLGWGMRAALRRAGARRAEPALLGILVVVPWFSQLLPIFLVHPGTAIHAGGPAFLFGLLMALGARR